jgi:hypothetical protein
METENFDSHLAEFENVDEQVPDTFIEEDDAEIRRILMEHHYWMD